MLERILDPLAHPEFWPGLVAGLVALGVVALAVFVLRRRGLGVAPHPGGGVVLALAAGGAVLWVGWGGGLLVSLWQALGFAALAGLLTLLAGQRGRGAAGSRAGSVGAGAAGGSRFGVVGSGAARAGSWVALAAAMWLAADRLGGAGEPRRLAMAAAGLGLGILLARFDATAAVHALGLPLALVTVGGIYATVPDAEVARATLATALPLALLGWPRSVLRFGPIGAPMTATLLVWVVASGGAPRAGALVGGFACVGLLACDPLARLLAGRSGLDGLSEDRRAVVAVIAHTAVVLTAARVAGLRDTAGEAAFVAVPLVLAVAVALALTGSARR